MTLADYITANLRKPFVWGEHDCVLFAARWAQAKTGVDYLAYIQPWTSAREAMRMVHDMGGMAEILDARLKRIPPNLARDGDIALYQRCLSIFSGAHIVGPNLNGLEFVNRMQAEAAWRLEN